MVAEAGMGEGPAVRGPQGGAVLHPLRHRAQLARAGPGLQGRDRPVGVREVPASRRARRLAPRLDHDAVDARAPRRDRRGPRGDLCPGAPGRRHAHPRRGARRAGPRRERGDRAADARQRAARPPLRAAVPVHRRLRGARAHGAVRRLRLRGRRHRGGPHGRGLRRGRLPARDRQRAHHPQSGQAGRHVRRAHRPVLRHARPDRGRAHRRGPPRVRAPLQGRRDGALLPALLALRHAADLLRQDELVRAHDRGEGRAARRQRLDRLAPGAHQDRPLRQVAREQRRLGAVARALLGHAAARLEVRQGPSRLRRLARRDRRARRHAARGRAPAVHRRGGPEVRGLRRRHAPGARPDRRLVGLRVHAVRAVARAVRERGHASASASPRTTSARRSTRRAGGSTRCSR